MALINELANKLVKEYNIRNEPDLFKRLKLSQEDIKLLSDWIKYRELYGYEDGYRRGEEAIKASFRDLIGLAKPDEY